MNSDPRFGKQVHGYPDWDSRFELGDMTVRGIFGQLDFRLIDQDLSS